MLLTTATFPVKFFVNNYFEVEANFKKNSLSRVPCLKIFLTHFKSSMVFRGTLLRVTNFNFLRLISVYHQDKGYHNFLKWWSPKGKIFCFLRLHLDIETVSCCLLLRMGNDERGLKLEKNGPIFNAMPKNKSPQNYYV